MSAAAAPANSIAAIPRRLREQVLRLIPQDGAKLRAPALGERVGIGIIIHTSARRAMPSVRIAHSPVFRATAYARRSLDKSEPAEAAGPSRQRSHSLASGQPAGRPAHQLGGAPLG